MTQGELRAVRDELAQRGYVPTWMALEQGYAQIGFNFLPGYNPAWLRAFQLPAQSATPDGFETAIRAWQWNVLQELEADRSSDVVRQLIREHGREPVMRAMDAAHVGAVHVQRH